MRARRVQVARIAVIYIPRRIRRPGISSRRKQNPGIACHGYIKYTLVELIVQVYQVGENRVQVVRTVAIYILPRIIRCA